VCLQGTQDVLNSKQVCIADRMLTPITIYVKNTFGKPWAVKMHLLLMHTLSLAWHPVVLANLVVEVLKKQKYSLG